VKTAILHATWVTPRESRRRMRSLPKRVRNYDVNRSTDAVVVLHRGRVVLERYGGETEPETPHLLMSISSRSSAVLPAISRFGDSWTPRVSSPISSLS
jgi:hypothetical protein